jgi:ketosteroid isomerase-like protein
MKRYLNTWFCTLMLVIGMALASAQRAGAQIEQPADPTSLLVAWERVAFGASQDIDAALALMSDDAVLTVLPPPPGMSSTWTGKAQIRQALEFNRRFNVMRENIGTPTVEGNKVTAKAMVTNNNFVLWGVAPVEHTTEVIVEGGRIKSYTSTMAPSERERVAAAATAYQQAQAAQPAGMPRTGDDQGSVQYLLLSILGMLTVAVGLGLRQRAAKRAG